MCAGQTMEDVARCTGQTLEDVAMCAGKTLEETAKVVRHRHRRDLLPTKTAKDIPLHGRQEVPTGAMGGGD